MNRTLILILGAAMACSAAFAQNEDVKAGGDRMDRMQKNLGLSDQQVVEIRRIRDAGGSKDEILGVLTEEQLAIMKERRAKMKRNGHKVKHQPQNKQSQTGENRA